MTDQEKLQTVGARFHADTRARLDRVAARLGQPGIPCSRAKAMRHIVLKYLDVAEKDLGIGVPATVPVAPKKAVKKGGKL